MTIPLEIRLEAETYGVESGDYREAHGKVILSTPDVRLDLTPYVKDFTLFAGVTDITRLDLTLINIRINREEES